MYTLSRCELDSHYFRLEVREPGGDWMGPYEWSISNPNQNGGKIPICPNWISEPIVRGPWLWKHATEVWDTFECYYTQYGWDMYLNDDYEQDYVVNNLEFFVKRTKEAGLEYRLLETCIEDLPGPIVFVDKFQIVCDLTPQKTVPFNKLRTWSGDCVWNAWGI